MHCSVTAVFKKDTKEKNQKKAEAKKRKAEQQEQQEPVDDDLAMATAQDEPTAAVTLLLQPEQLPAQQPAQPGLSHIQAQIQLPPAAQNTFPVHR